MQLARAVEQREVLQRALAQREEMFSLTRQRVSAGLDTAVELRQSEGAAARDAPADRGRRRADRARRAMRSPRSLAEPPQRFETLAPTLSTLRPVADSRRRSRPICVGRRADIVAARWRVEAATGDVAAQRAQFYPNVNLVALRRPVDARPRPAACDAGSEQYGVGPAIRLPIFDAGRLRAGLRGRTADLDAAVETYNGTLVDAIHDVADQISSTRIGRAPAARAGRRAGVGRGAPTTWRRSAIAPASAATSPCSTPRAT